MSTRCENSCIHQSVYWAAWFGNRADVKAEWRVLQLWSLAVWMDGLEWFTDAHSVNAWRVGESVVPRVVVYHLLLSQQIRTALCSCAESVLFCVILLYAM